MDGGGGLGWMMAPLSRAYDENQTSPGQFIDMNQGSRPFDSRAAAGKGEREKGPGCRKDEAIECKMVRWNKYQPAVVARLPAHDKGIRKHCGPHSRWHVCLVFVTRSIHPVK